MMSNVWAFSRHELKQRFQNSSVITWGVADQVIISGSNFLLMLVVARSLDPALFGIFGIYYLVLMLMVSVQFGIISSPHNVIGQHLRGQNYRDFSRSVAHAQRLFTIIILILGLFTIIVAISNSLAQTKTLAMFFLTLTSYLAQDFYRRILHTERRQRDAAMVDILGFGGQALAVTLLWMLGILTSVLTVLLVMAALAGSSTWLGVVLTRASFAGKIEPRYMRQMWEMGRWLGGSSLIGWLSAQLPTFVGAWILGPGAVGVFRATETLMRPLGILLAVFDTILPIRFSHLLGENGRTKMEADFRRISAGYVILLLVICLFLLILGPALVSTLFGNGYAGHEWLPAGFGFMYLLMGANKLLGARVRALRKSAVLFSASLGGLFSATILVWPLVHSFGVYGMLICVLAVYFVSLASQLVFASEILETLG